MIRCSVCKLDPERRGAINAALLAGVSLQEISAGCGGGISKSSLHRHAQHLQSPQNSAEAAPTAPVAAAPAPPSSTQPNKERLLERIELLWEEGLEGLEASKQAIVLKKADGSTIELNAGDLRARPAFLRELRQILELQGEADGTLTREGGGPTVAIQIVCPVVGQSARPPAEGAAVIEIGPNRR